MENLIYQMSCSATSDSSTIPLLCEQRLDFHFAEIKQKLDDLIYKEQVNQLWKLGVESTLHSIWNKVCYQHVRVSTGSQTDELLVEDYDTSSESAIHLDKTSRVLQEAERGLNIEELHNAVAVIPPSSSSAHGNEMSASFASPEQPMKRGKANDVSRAIQQGNNSTAEQDNSFASNAEENECNGEEQQDVVEVIPSSSPSPSTSSQTDEQFDEYVNSLLESAIRFNETSPIEEESELSHEELHNAVEVLPSSPPSAHEKESSVSFASPQQHMKRGNANDNLAKHIRFCSNQQNENVHLDEMSLITQEHNHSFASSADAENELNGEEQQVVVEVVHSSSSSTHENEMSLSDTSPEQLPKRAKKPRSNPGEFYQCSRCECKFTRKVDMSRHERTHLKPPFKCENCLQVFESHIGFTRHRRVCTSWPNENGSFECPECGNSYSTAVKLKQHIWYHGEKTQKKHKCTVCGRAFICLSQLGIHMNSHTGATPFHCKFCLKSFATQSGYRNHIRVYHPKSQQTT